MARAPLKPIISVGPGGSSATSSDTITSAVSVNLQTQYPSSHGLILTGSGNLTGIGNNQSYNYLSAAQNSGNTTLVAGAGDTLSRTTLVGGSGSNSLYGATSAGTLSLIGGSGNSTMVAGTGAANLIGGAKNNSLVAGSGTQSLWGGSNNGSVLYGNTLRGGSGKDTLRSGTGYNTLISGSQNTNQSNTLLGGGISNSLVAGKGNDSLAAISGKSTLIGGTGKDTLLGGTGTNWLQSGSTLNGNANTLIGGIGNNTLVAGAGKDSLVGASGSAARNSTNAFLFNQNNLANATIVNDSLSANYNIQNSIILGFDNQTVNDSAFANISNVGTLSIATKTGAKGDNINLGDSAEAAGIRTLIGGTGSDILSVAGYSSLAGAMLDARASGGSSTMIGGAGDDTFYTTRNGRESIKGGAGNDLIVFNKASSSNTFNLSTLDGGEGQDTLSVNQKGQVILGSQGAFANFSNIEVLSLAGGTNTVSSLQGSGITGIIGGTGNDSLSAIVGVTLKNSAVKDASVITLNSTAGLASGQHISGAGIAVGTTIIDIDTLANKATLSSGLTKGINAGSLLTAAIDGATLDASRSFTDATTSQNFLLKSAASKGATAIYLNPSTLRDPSSLFVGQFLSGSGLADGTQITGIQYQSTSWTITLSKATAGAISMTAPITASYDVSKLSGDYLVGEGQGVLLIGPTLAGSSMALSQAYAAGNSNLARVTFVAGAYAENTLIGGDFDNTFIINTQTSVDSQSNDLGYISAGTHYAPDAYGGLTGRMTGNNVLLIANQGASLGDDAFLNVGTTLNGEVLPTIQTLSLSGGKNLLLLGASAQNAGISTIYGSTGADTISTSGYDALLNTFIDDRRSVGNTSLSGGAGNDTILAGTGNATIDGGDGNNSLVGGVGSNFILAGIGNSTLDGGSGSSSLQAGIGSNTYIVRNSATRILSTGTADHVISYVNFDPIQSTQVNQFAPTLPDGSPSITKAPSFASADLSSFYNIQNFTLQNGVQYGVANALGNNIVTNGTQAHLVLGMGGDNTITSAGVGDTLIGYVNQAYASPDLYATAPFDTRTQEFVDSVIGAAGNNYIVANGARSYLDGGPGYNSGLGDASGSNTLIGNGGNSTFVVHNINDSIVAAGAGNEIISSVNLHSLVDNVNKATLIVTSQYPNLPNITANTQKLPPNSGQTDPANFLGFGNGNPNSTESFGYDNGDLHITVANASMLQVQYSASEGQQYEADGADATTPDDFQPLTVGSFTPDPNPNHPARLATTLTWDAPAGDFGGDVLGYTVYYRITTGGVPGPWLTYVNGNSTDFQGTSNRPSLLVNNLPAYASDGITPLDHSNYDFRVTAQQLTLPTVTDPVTRVASAAPVTLQGSNGNDVLWGFMGGVSSVSGGQQLGTTTWYNDVNAILTNNPIDPNDPGFIAVPPSYGPTHTPSSLFPTYLDGRDGNNLMISRQVGYGDGTDFTVRGVTFSGLNTMVGGTGSDTFIVSNGTRNNFDLIIKEGGRTPVDYTNKAPGAPDGIDPSGVSLNGGQHNLVISRLDEIQLSDTVVSQGMFIDQLLLIGGGQFGMGNRLDNFLYDINGGSNTLVGNTGRDSIVAGKNGGGDVLIGGTATGLDNIALAMMDLYGVSPYPTNTVPYVIPDPADPTVGGGFTSYTPGDTLATDSIYRDTDPVPVGVVNNGPGSSSTSQYWTVPGSYGPAYDALRNSDTLNASNANGACTLDGGAGNDLMIGTSLDGKSDWFYVSAASFDSLSGTGYASARNQYIESGDVLVGNGGNDWVMFTGSDVYWSGKAGATSAILTFALSDDGDFKGGQSISNVKLQDGDPVAREAIGNSKSTGNQHNSKLGFELGSNLLIGNEFDNTLNGGGVGGTNGTGVGVDTLQGGTGADYFYIGSYYRSSASNEKATYSSPTATVPQFQLTANATDADYAEIMDFDNSDKLVLTGSLSQYLIGSAPSGFTSNNINGGTPASASNFFGIYYAPGSSTPNLVAVVKCIDGMTLGGNLVYQSFNGIDVDGTKINLGGDALTPGLASGNATGLNYLGFGAMYKLDGSDFGNNNVSTIS